jgi:hypothetical protein
MTASRYAMAGRFADRAGDDDGAQISLVQGMIASGMSHQNISRQTGSSVPDVARYAALIAREVERPNPGPRPPRKAVVLSLWKGLIQREARPYSMLEILDHVATDYHLTVEELKGHSRQIRITRPRQDFMWRCRQEKDAKGQFRFSLSQIGMFLGGLHHTSVMHGVKAHAKRLVELREQRAA